MINFKINKPNNFLSIDDLKVGDYVTIGEFGTEVHLVIEVEGIKTFLNLLDGKFTYNPRHDKCAIRYNNITIEVK